MSWPEYVCLLVGAAALVIGLFNIASAGHGWAAAIILGLVVWGIYLGLTL